MTTQRQRSQSIRLAMRPMPLPRLQTIGDESVVQRLAFVDQAQAGPQQRIVGRHATSTT